MTIAADTSALVAILFDEPDAKSYVMALAQAGKVIIGAPTIFELKLVLHRSRRPLMIEAADLLLDDFTVVPWTADHVAAAVDALARFGGRPARLNFGDCMAYAVAKVAGCALLYKGGDFALTDVMPAR